MTWYNSNFKRRYPVSIDVLTSSETKGLKDIQFDVPSDWDDFWSEIRPDGFDIVITNKLGELQTFRRLTYNYTNRQLTLTGQNIYFDNLNSINLVYIYFSYPNQSSDLSSAFAATTPRPGKIYLNAPSNRVVTNPIQRTGTTSPSFVFTKTYTDQVYIWFKVSSILATRITSYNEKLDFESVSYVKIESLDASGTNDTARYDEEATAIIPGYIGIKVKNGSNNTDYTLCCNIQTFATNFAQFISLRCTLQIRNQLPI